MRLPGGKKPKDAGAASSRVCVGFNAATGRYIEPDYRGWAEAEGIAIQGQKDGGDKFPPADQATPDGSHLKIQTYVAGLAQKCREEVTEFLGTLMESIHAVQDEAGLEVLAEEAKRIGEKAKGDLDAQAQSDLAQLKPMLADYQAQEAAVATFRKEHGLGQRMAQDSKRTEALIWIIGIMIAECGFNAFMLADVSPSGLLGALSMTVIITAVNVLVGVVFVGEGWRATNASAEATRMRGYCQAIGLAVLLVAFNVLVAHGRDAMQLLEAELRGGGTLNAFASVGENAWAQFLEAPFEFESFKAPLLMVAGIVCFLLGSWKGYERDDPYPGFGEISRKLREVREDYQDGREEAVEQMATLHKQAEREFDDLLHTAKWRVDQYEAQCDQGRQTQREYPVQMTKYERYLRELVQTYRDANRRARQGEPAPKYFDEEMALDAELLEAPEFDPPTKPGVGELAKAIGAQRSALQAHYDTLMAATYPPK